jgi:SAM-dependent methyltransferase
MPADLDDYRRASLEIWDRMASGWFRERDWMWQASRAVGERMVEQLRLGPGQTVLELAAGAGDTGFAAAASVRDGRVISTDFSPAMVDLARRRAEELGIENAQFRVLDAEHMDLGEDSVDAVLCRWGYMLMADPAAALSETRRVLRDSGRLCFSVWAEPARNPWATLAGGLMVERGLIPPPDPEQPGIFNMADPDRIRSLVVAAGFGEPEIDDFHTTWHFDDFDAFWAFLTGLAGHIALVIDELDSDGQTAVRDGLRQRLEAFRSHGGYDLPGLCWVVTAAQPVER